MPIGTSGVPEAPSGIVLAKCFGMCSIEGVRPMLTVVKITITIAKKIAT
jgi:hypothetical protein